MDKPLSDYLDEVIRGESPPYAGCAVINKTQEMDQCVEALRRFIGTTMDSAGRKDRLRPCAEAIHLIL